MSITAASSVDSHSLDALYLLRTERAAFIPRIIAELPDKYLQEFYFRQPQASMLETKSSKFYDFSLEQMNKLRANCIATAEGLASGVSNFSSMAYLYADLAAQIAIEDVSSTIHERVCVEWQYCEKRKNSGEDITYIVALADILTNEILPKGMLMTAVYISQRHLLDKHCNC